jgi:hypothetical protein
MYRSRVTLAALSVLGCADSLGPTADAGALQLALEVEPAIVAQHDLISITTRIVNTSSDTVRLHSPSGCLNTIQLFRRSTRIEPWSGISFFCLGVLSTFVIGPGDTLLTRYRTDAEGPPGEYRIRSVWEPDGLPALEARVTVR